MVFQVWLAFVFLVGASPAWANTKTFLGDSQGEGEGNTAYQLEAAGVQAASPYQRFFRLSDGVYWHDGNQYCVFTSLEHYYSYAGFYPPERLAYGSWATEYLEFVGGCLLPAGHFFVGNTGYFANQWGEYCAYSSWEHFTYSGGTIAAKRFPVIPDRMDYHGSCLFHQGHFFVGQGGLLRWYGLLL